MFLTVSFLYPSFLKATELEVVGKFHASRTYFFPHVLQAKAYFSMSGRWLLTWALRFPLYTNPLRQCSHLNGRFSSGRWHIICLSYVSSLLSSFPHSWHLKSPNRLWKENVINRAAQSLSCQATMMPNIFSVVPNTFRSLFQHFCILKHKELQLYHADFYF